jgi:hypothetical protein
MGPDQTARMLVANALCWFCHGAAHNYVRWCTMYKSTQVICSVKNRTQCVIHVTGSLGIPFLAFIDWALRRLTHHLSVTYFPGYRENTNSELYSVTAPCWAPNVTGWGKSAAWPDLEPGTLRILCPGSTDWAIYSLVHLHHLLVKSSDKWRRIH